MLLRPTGSFKAEDLRGQVVLPRDLATPDSIEDCLSEHCSLIQSGAASGAGAEESCAVCLDVLAQGLVCLEFQGCGHRFHDACLRRWLKERRRCPVCSQACGVVFGTGPRVGTMSWHCEQSHLPGYPGCGTVVLTFAIPSSTDESGTQYSGRSVTAYLPNQPGGRHVLELFSLAFRRRLLFSLGVSLTLGVRWPTFNIHLKTCRTGGAPGHGYPDAGYLERVQLELADNGITLQATVPKQLRKSSAARTPASHSGDRSALTDRQNTSKADDDDVTLKTCTSLNLANTRRTQAMRSGDNSASVAKQETSQVDDDVMVVGAPSASAAGHPRRWKRAALESIINLDDEAILKRQCTPLRRPRRLREGKVPCEVCGELVRFEDYVAHGALHKREPTETTQVPCDVCGSLVAFDEYEAHMATHSSNASSSAGASHSSMKRCEVCSTLVSEVDYADHLKAHELHSELVDEDLQKSAAPADVALQVVELARRYGSGLPGNRSAHAGLDVGSQVLVRWQDGQYYSASVREVHAGKYLVAWDQCCGWPPTEEVAGDAVIPRATQPCDVCNFDVAMKFVDKLKEYETKGLWHGCVIELVYHWTREENIQKIVENNLRVPGEANADGSSVNVVNGERYGRGIYAATDLAFGKHFGKGAACAFLCLAISGVQAPPGTAPQHLMSFDSAAPDDRVRVYRTSAQLLPLFATNEAYDSQLRANAEQVADFLRRQLSVPAPKLGETLYAEEAGRWYKAVVAHCHSDGNCDVSWAAPFSLWPKGKRIPPHRLRRHG